ncbi:MAG: T9SS type A sorting domain-containing protein [Bacteroidota bacterium]
MLRSNLLTICLIIICFQLSGQIPFSGKQGFGFSPQGYPDHHTTPDIINFYNEVAAMPCGGIIMWNGLWYQDSTTIGQVPVAAYGNTLNGTVFGYEDINVFTFFHWPNLVWLNTPAQHVPNNFSNTDTRSSFLQALKLHAQNDQPTMVFIGNEVSFYLCMDSINYQHFVSFYNMAYDTIKHYSPATKVGTIFNYEHLSGKGSLTGWNTPHWNALTDMDTSRMDAIGITLYPFFNYTNANDIPPGYLDDLTTHTGNKKIVITETGWPADQTFLPAPWTCSATQQVDYTHTLFNNIINNKPVKSINWLFLNYLMSDINDGYKIFRSVALRDSLNIDRPAKAIWDSVCIIAKAPLLIEYANKIIFFPNPAENEITLKLEKPLPENAELNIFNNVGENIIRKNIFKVAKVVRIDITTLPSGIYFVKLSNNSGKFIKM